MRLNTQTTLMVHRADLIPAPEAEHLETTLMVHRADLISAPDVEHLETTLMVHRAGPCTCARPGLHRADPGASQTLVLDWLPGERGIPGEDSKVRCMFCSDR